MKTSIKYIVAIFAMAFTFVSCSSDDDSTPVNELSGITKFKEITNDTHTIELYSNKVALELGYNDISLRIKNNATNQYVKDAAVSWKPLMHMTARTHACPYSSVEKVTENGTLYKGYIMFQMPQNETEYWDLNVTYTISGVEYTATSVINVPDAAKRRVNVFAGSDGTKYLVALVNPTSPKVAINDFKVGVWKMDTMMNFPVVDGYTVKIDPRMPSMGNHSSPNNVNATQASAGGLYNGKLSMTMSGYWKINLQLANAEGTILKGEEITDSVEASSIFFEIEF
ncbi:FixH family protein [Flavobacterium ardleyense]|uniref:FixH family protein n=1 Tax=Flavobacterium ardleyense TaxID=2038737 RepID=A0ABW5Z5Q1_9FLAO